jgi:hypothetical protein
MNPTLKRAARLLAKAMRHEPTGASLSVGMESILQTFENCRPGMPDGAVTGDRDVAERFFTEIYEKEAPRLREVIQVEDAHLSGEKNEQFFLEVDQLVRRVVIPAYVREALRFTKRERNDFYLLDDPLHGLERVLWGAAGLGLGAFIVWAPFIPLWSKEWMLPFTVLGLLFPNIRRFLAIRRYEGDLDRIAGSADREIGRIELAYMTSAERSPGGVARKVATPEAELPPPTPTRNREGGHR